MRDTTWVRRLLTWSIIVVGASGSTADAAEPMDRFFDQRQVTLLVGGGSGGGIDTYARLFARHIPRHMPGGPTIVVKNLPAAGGVQAYTTLYNTAARDGSALATSARGPLADPLLSDKPPTYNVLEFIWIGGLNDDLSMCHTMAASKVRTVGDARAQEATMGATGVFSESGKFPLALNAAIGTRFRVIPGYKGTGGLLLALERGEVDGRCSTFSSIFTTRPEWVRDGKVHMLVQVGLTKHPDFPEVPLALDLAKSPEDKQLIRFVAAPLSIASAFALPPEVPSDRVAGWRRAFSALVKDPEMLTEAKKLNLEIKPKNGEEIREILKDIYATSKPVLKRAAEIFDRSK